MHPSWSQPPGQNSWMLSSKPRSAGTSSCQKWPWLPAGAFSCQSVNKQLVPRSSSSKYFPGGCDFDQSSRSLSQHRAWECSVARFGHVSAVARHECSPTEWMPWVPRIRVYYKDIPRVCQQHAKLQRFTECDRIFLHGGAKGRALVRSIGQVECTHIALMILLPRFHPPHA